MSKVNQLLLKLPNMVYIINIKIIIKQQLWINLLMIIINADLLYATKALLHDDDDNTNQQNYKEYNIGSNFGTLKMTEKTTYQKTNTNNIDNVHIILL